MIIYNGSKAKLEQFINDLGESELKENAIRAADYAGIEKENYNEYFIIKVEGYYNIVHIVSEGDINELDSVVYPFDRERIYPEQRIEQKIVYKR